MISVQSVIREVAFRTGTTPDLLKGPRRSRPLAYPRQLAFLLSASLCPHTSIVKISKEFNRDHTTVLYGIKRAQTRLRENPALQKLADEICEQIKRGNNASA